MTSIDPKEEDVVLARALRVLWKLPIEDTKDAKPLYVSKAQRLVTAELDKLGYEVKKKVT